MQQVLILKIRASFWHLFISYLNAFFSGNKLMVISYMVSSNLFSLKDDNIYYTTSRRLPLILAFTTQQCSRTSRRNEMVGLRDF